VRNLRPVRGPRRKPDLQITIDDASAEGPGFKAGPCAASEMGAGVLSMSNPRLSGSRYANRPPSGPEKLSVPSLALALEITEGAGAGGDKVAFLS